LRPDPASPSVTHALLRSAGLRPRRRLGQNFLCDGNVLERIADSALGGGCEPVVEIGAGLGALTARLAVRSRLVTTVEIDAALHPILEQTLAGLANVEVLIADFLQLDTVALFGRTFGPGAGVVAGNIPYGITSPILERLFASKDRLLRAALLVQTEVADRLTARPGTKAYGSLTVFCAFHGTMTRAFRVPPHLFYPAPDVGSTLVVFEPHDPPSSLACPTEAVFRVIRAAFAQRRKTLANAVAGGGLAPDAASASEALMSCGVDPTRRGETLTLDEFIMIANALHASALGYSDRSNPDGRVVNQPVEADFERTP